MCTRRILSAEQRGTAYHRFPTAFVPIDGAHELNSAVAVIPVVPANEIRDPMTRILEVLEALARVPGAVLEGTEERLGERVVIADPGPCERRHDAERLQGGEHRRALHRTAVVRVKCQGVDVDVLRVRSAPNKGGRQIHVLGLVDRPADDFARPDIDHHVEEEERPAGWAAEVRDVPAPDLVRAGRHPDDRHAFLRRLRTAPVGELLLRLQHPVHRRLGAEVFAPLRQAGDDLARR